MTDIHARFRKALQTAADYELIGSLAQDPQKREKFRALARFERDVAAELRREMAGAGAEILNLDQDPGAKGSALGGGRA